MPGSCDGAIWICGGGSVVVPVGSVVVPTGSVVVPEGLWWCWGVCGGARGELWWFQGTLGVLMGSAVMPAPRGRAELSGKPTLLLRGHSCTAGPVRCSKSRGHHRVTPTPLLGATCPFCLAEPCGLRALEQPRQPWAVLSQLPPAKMGKSIFLKSCGIP